MNAGKVSRRCIMSGIDLKIPIAICELILDSIFDCRVRSNSFGSGALSKKFESEDGKFHAEIFIKS
jgi:hypothetical protein